MAEIDLYPPVKAFLEAQGYEVKAEVRDCDVVAIRPGDAPVIVELKATFSLSLLLQGVDRQAITDAVYLACPAPRRRQLGDILKVCRRLGLGLLVVSGRSVDAVLDPAPYQPRKSAPRRSMLLREFAHRVGDPNIGGSARGPRMTAYRQDALRCAAFLGDAGASELKRIRAGTAVVRAAAILQDDVYGWFQRHSRGVYGLSAKGTAAIAENAAAIQALCREFIAAA